MYDYFYCCQCLCVKSMLLIFHSQASTRMYVMFFLWKHIYLSVVIFVFSMCEIQNWAFFSTNNQKISPNFTLWLALFVEKKASQEVNWCRWNVCVCCLLGISKLLFYLIYKTTHKYGPLTHFTSLFAFNQTALTATTHYHCLNHIMPLLPHGNTWNITIPF